MADWTGTLNGGLTDQVGISDARAGGLSSNVTAAKDLPNQIVVGSPMPSAPSLMGSSEFTEQSLVSGVAGADWAGYLFGGPHEFWFEFIHTVPERLELGNILATVVRDIEIYNAYREEDHQLTAAVNNVDAGVSFQNLPGLPYTITAQDGITFQVKVTTSGPPEIEGTLDFTMDTGPFDIPVTGVRVVMFAFEPEAPIQETLEWNTQILETVDGSEQRINNRKHPRQMFRLNMKMEDDPTRRFFQSLMFGFQPGTFGMPIWSDARYPTQDINTSDTIIYLDTTYADFREQSLIIIWKNQEEYDALEVQTVAAGSLTLSSPVQNDYQASEVLVMPLRVAITDQTVQVNRHFVNLDEVSLNFEVLDNETDVADDSGYTKHNGFVLLDQPNMSGGMLGDGLARRMGRIDNKTAPPLQYSDWNASRFNTSKGWACNSSQEIWSVRQLVHALRGSQVSFYMPTFYHDLVISNTLASGSFLMDIDWIGYDSLISGNEPNKSVWIELNDGTIYTRQVVDSEVLSATTERLTVDVAWSATVQPAEIKRVSFLRLCRIADDRVVFEHGYSGQAQASMQVMAVQT